MLQAYIAIILACYFFSLLKNSVRYQFYIFGVRKMRCEKTSNLHKVIIPLWNDSICFFILWKYVYNWKSPKYLVFSSVQSLGHAQLFATPRTAACQASLSITKCQNLPKPMSIELVMPSNHLILYRPLLLLPSIFPSIRVFSNESALHIRWPKHWSFSFNINPSNEHSGLMSFRMDWLDLLAVQGTKSLFQHHS